MHFSGSKYRSTPAGVQTDVQIVVICTVFVRGANQRIPP
jgi:hypothetical protein